MGNYPMTRIIQLSKKIEELTDMLLDKCETPISALNLSTRARHILFRCGIEHVELLVKCTYHDLKRMRCMGDKTIAEIKDKLKAYTFRRWPENI